MIVLVFCHFWLILTLSIFNCRNARKYALFDSELENSLYLVETHDYYSPWYNLAVHPFTTTKPAWDIRMSSDVLEGWHLIVLWNTQKQR